MAQHPQQFPWDCDKRKTLEAASQPLSSAHVPLLSTCLQLRSSHSAACWHLEPSRPCPPPNILKPSLPWGIMAVYLLCAHQVEHTILKEAAFQEKGHVAAEDRCL